MIVLFYFDTLSFLFPLLSSSRNIVTNIGNLSISVRWRAGYLCMQKYVINGLDYEEDFRIRIGFNFD